MSEMDNNHQKLTQSPLLNLPAELREQIYSNCVDDELSKPLEQAETRLSTAVSYTHPDDKPREPALTRVSKAVRAECLPLYYSAYVLPVRTVILVVPCGPLLHMQTEPWYRSISPPKLAQIQHFRFVFILFHRRGWERIDIEFRLDWLKRFRDYHLRFTPCGWHGDSLCSDQPSDYEELCIHLKRHLGKILDGWVEQPGARWCTAQLLDQLVDMDQDALPLGVIAW